MRVIKVGVVGCGYWGPNLVRNFARHPGVEVAGVCDTRYERALKVGSEYRVPVITDRVAQLMEDRNIDLIVLATPTHTHFDLAKKAIAAHKHVLVMKPLTTSAAEAAELCELARKEGVLLAVDHTFVFTAAVQRMRDMVRAGDLGDLYYFDSVRVNLGLFQSDINVIWDLAPHDISILDFIVGGQPAEVTAIGVAHGGSPTENIAYITMRYPNSFLAHVHVNWLAPAKVRRTILGGSKKMLVYDDAEPTEKIKIYDKGVSFQASQGSEDPYALLVSYRTGDMLAPNLSGKEALAVEVENIVKAIRGEEALVSDGQSGLRVVQILEAAQASINSGGRPVQIVTPGAPVIAPNQSAANARS
jgi:predicted dehydrogenase